jgi:hypothetical protein
MRQKTLSDVGRLVVDRYGRMAAAGKGREFYGSVERAIQAAAARLVFEKLLAAENAEDAVKEVTKFVACGEAGVTF